MSCAVQWAQALAVQAWCTLDPTVELQASISFSASASVHQCNLRVVQQRSCTCREIWPWARCKLLQCARTGAEGGG